jgi:pyrimidine-nucleoside phosphorylase
MRRAIERKRDGERLAPEVWSSIVESYMDGEVDDAQMAALAMACVWRGLSTGETTALTRALVESGAVLRFSGDAAVVDKHSTGGVSDIVSLVAVPLVAACGVRVAKLSGRALGHTGGTIDKLEAIPGCKVALPLEDVVRQVERVGCAIAAQTEALVPADKRLYRLRDHTGTVPSPGLIAASIVSKKIAGGASAFVFDVKCGSAAFVREPEEAAQLARMLVEVSSRFERHARAFVTDMNEPLGTCLGTGIEVMEACRVLRGESEDPRVREVCLTIAGAMLELGGVARPHETARDALASGAAYEKFVAMICAQGSTEAALASLAFSERTQTLSADCGGYVWAIDGVRLGNAARDWSAHDRGAGIRVRARIGDRVTAGDPLADVYGADAEAVRIADAFTVEASPPPVRPLMYASF